MFKTQFKKVCIKAFKEFYTGSTGFTVLYEGLAALGAWGFEILGIGGRRCSGRGGPEHALSMRDEPHLTVILFGMKASLFFCINPRPT